MRTKKLSGENFIDGIQISDYKTITAGIYTGLIANEGIIFCNTAGGNIELQGFSGGIIGQSIRLVKNVQANQLRIRNNNANGIEKIFTTGNKNIDLGNYGVVEFVFDGTNWFANV